MKMVNGEQTDVQFPYSLSSLSEVWVQEESIPRAVAEQFFASDTKKDKKEILYSFYHPDVRRKLLNLVKTDVVRIMDKNFMLNLQDKLYQNYWDDFENRLVNRRATESERREKLALRGVQPLDDNTLDDHPIIQVSKLVQEKMEDHRRKTKKPQWKPRKEDWDYTQFQTLSDLESENSEVSLIDNDIADLDTVRKTRRKLKRIVDEAVEIGQLPTEDILENLKYERPLVKQLRKLRAVDELYDLADKILTIRGKSARE